MNWEAVSAVGQLIGSIAVVITLAYLAVQVQQAKQAVRRSTTQQRAAGARQLTFNRSSNESLRRIMMKGRAALGATPFPQIRLLMERAGLDEVEADVVFWTFHFEWSFISEVFSHFEDLSPAEQRETNNALAANLEADPLYRLWYDSMKPGLNHAIVQHIDGVLAALPIASQ